MPLIALAMHYSPQSFGNKTLSIYLDSVKVYPQIIVALFNKIHICLNTLYIYVYMHYIKYMALTIIYKTLNISVAHALYMCTICRL